jgi:hypothetical protein
MNKERKLLLYFWVASVILLYLFVVVAAFVLGRVLIRIIIGG